MAAIPITATHISFPVPFTWLTTPHGMVELFQFCPIMSALICSIQSFTLAYCVVNVFIFIVYCISFTMFYICSAIGNHSLFQIVCFSLVVVGSQSSTIVSRGQLFYKVFFFCMGIFFFVFELNSIRTIQRKNNKTQKVTLIIF